jgi:hypothetical protein
MALVQSCRKAEHGISESTIHTLKKTTIEKKGSNSSWINGERPFKAVVSKA